MRAGALRLMKLANRFRVEQDPVQRVDLLTSLADARSALCVDQGVAMEDINGRGYNMSVAAYRRVYASWMDLLAVEDTEFTRPKWEQVRALWMSERPDVVAAVERAALKNAA